MGAVPVQYVPLDEYFRLEETRETKHEYLHGVIYAMAGASTRHNLILAHIIGSLDTQLRGKSCAVYPGDLRVKVEASSLYTYPDASVIRGEIQNTDGRDNTFMNPSVRIEVLSPSSENYDRGNKFQHYRTIESFREYLVVAQNGRRVEHYQRQREHRWLLVEYSRNDQQILLDTIGCTLAMDLIYEKVVFDAGE